MRRRYLASGGVLILGRTQRFVSPERDGSDSGVSHDESGPGRTTQMACEPIERTSDVVVCDRDDHCDESGFDSHLRAMLIGMAGAHAEPRSLATIGSAVDQQVEVVMHRAALTDMDAGLRTAVVGNEMVLVSVELRVVTGTKHERRSSSRVPRIS